MDLDLQATMRWHNGEKGWNPFSDAEMDRRQAGIRALLAARNIDAALFTSYHNICYLSGFLYCSFGRRYGLVIDHERTTVIAAGIDGGQPWRRSHGDVLTYTDWNRDNWFTAVGELAGTARRIGIEFDHVTLDTMTRLKSAFPQVEFVDIAGDAMRLRTIKSAEEQALIREGTRICDIGGAAVAGAVEAGVAEHEVALAGTRAMVREIAASFPFAELMDTWTWFQSGINTDGAHNPVTNRKVESGDILSLNCFPMIFGYYTALERTLFCDHVPDANLKPWEINCEVHRRGLELIRPGARCRDIAAELNEIYRAHDLLRYRSFGYGHSFGVLSHYYGREASVELREDVDTVLEPGMVVSMEPMIMIPEGLPGAGGYREHDILIVTGDGAENITGFPFGPDHNVVGKVSAGR
ncbi:MAG: creatininase [Stappia sp.]|uniref:M24 family metallopeptidase n=1 Tax=Stappia sp. TaxID=1870903 RepID=UPI000C67E52D|nr:M24 family metallopeptidase [Stappia sp.]MAA98604.1 creatininase [Stappia sp.]MBM20567.1 creatininase [Stappia sp.]